MRDVRSVLIETAARLLERVAGHLLTAPNMMWGDEGTQSEVTKRVSIKCVFNEKTSVLILHFTKKANWDEREACGRLSSR